MPDDARDFLKGEYECGQKTYEVQFNHFMGVFNFWVAVITLPSAAGLITLMATRGTTDPNAVGISDRFVGLLLAILGTIGVFLAAKMFDIRKAQLGYIDDMNHAREELYNRACHDLGPTYKPPRFLGNQDLQKVACEDFGKWMAVVMSLFNAVYIAAAVWYLVSWRFPALLVALLVFLFGCGNYIALVVKRVPPGRAVTWWQAYKALLPIKRCQLQRFIFADTTETAKVKGGGDAAERPRRADAVAVGGGDQSRR